MKLVAMIVALATLLVIVAAAPWRPYRRYSLPYGYVRRPAHRVAVVGGHLYGTGGLYVAKTPGTVHVAPLYG